MRRRSGPRPPTGTRIYNIAKVQWSEFGAAMDAVLIERALTIEMVQFVGSMALWRSIPSASNKRVMLLSHLETLSVGIIPSGQDDVMSDFAGREDHIHYRDRAYRYVRIVCFGTGNGEARRAKDAWRCPAQLLRHAGLTVQCLCIPR
ncbi:hypothetical protein EVAR_33606_1 [Eumeta japonica]|uniref:Uncharacterized protein n=1 Tax=Eumeta variegata TaxID=151549 RepID=A0A4C1WBQ1_EUMVA|nr:hypothetical protein EVAR_33606_1 [Eumeta japonica]